MRFDSHEGVGLELEGFELVLPGQLGTEIQIFMTSTNTSSPWEY